MHTLTHQGSFRAEFGRYRDLIDGVGTDWPENHRCSADRFSVYSDIPDGRHQFCRAHLIRDVRAMVDQQHSGTDDSYGGHFLQTQPRH
jgi:hypothetical protein